MATNPVIKPRRGTAAPGVGAITQNELAVDTTNKRIYIGAADGSGTLIGAAPGGSDTQVQFNDGGNLGGDSGLTYSKTTDTLTITGGLAVNGADVTTTSTGTVTLFNTNATGVYVGSAATDIRLGKTDNTGTTRIYGTLYNIGGTITTNTASSSIFDTTATTLDIGGAATTLTIGHDGTSASTTNITTGATGSGSTKTVNLGTGAAAGSTTNVNIGSSNGGTTTVNSATLVGNSTTQNLFNTTATTLNMGGVATAITMGDATTATTTIRGGTLVGNTTTQNLFNTTATTLNVGGAATSILFGATTGSATIKNPSIYLGWGSAATILSGGASAGTSHLTLAPDGELRITPSNSNGVGAGGSTPSIVVQNTDAGVGQVQITGGNLYLGRTTSNGSTYSPSTIILEGASNNANDLTLTLDDPTSSRTITFPDATGTVGVMASPTNQQIQFYDSATKNLKGDADLTFDGTNLQIGSQGDLRLADADSSHYVAFQAPSSVSANITWTLPSTDGTSGQALVTDGTGTLSFSTVSGSAGPTGPAGQSTSDVHFLLFQAGVI